MKKLISTTLVVLVLLTGCHNSIENTITDVTSNPGETNRTNATTLPPADIPPPPGVEVDNEWALWLINGNNPLPADYEPEISLIGTFNGQERNLDVRAVSYALNMIQAAKDNGITLEIVSSFRFISTQARNFRAEFDDYIAAGYTREQAYELTAQEIAVPGTSEHNAGLAIDFNDHVAFVHESFENTEAFAWLNAHAYEYGFILRYPKNTQHITGIIYEPWHWRFVGVYHAGKIRESGLTLEEYIGVCAGDNSVVAAWKNELIGG
jgi:D-alanyl-D-alanine carboxypeptidase